MVPLTHDDVLAARERIRPYLDASPVRHYPLLDALVGHDIRVLVKHENHLPTGSFKVRNGVSAVMALSDGDAARGVIGASTGNHGQGLAWAGARRGIPVTIGVPVGNNPDKTAAMRALGANVLEVGTRYDETIVACEALAARDGATLVHSTNHRDILAGAGTMTLEFLEQAPEVDVLIVSLGGGSQAVGGSAVRDVVKPSLQIIAVGAAGASAQYTAWHTHAPVAHAPVRTFAEGIATGSSYVLTFDTLQRALADFVIVDDDAIAQAVRDLWSTTHNLAEGAGAAGLAGVRVLAPHLAGKTVGIVISGGNLDAARAATILAGGTPRA